MIKKKKKYHIAIAGATGAVGRKMLAILEERNFPVDGLKLLASPRSTGKVLEFKGEKGRYKTAGIPQNCGSCGTLW